MKLIDRIRSTLPSSCILCNLPVRRAASLCVDCQHLLPAVEVACSVCGVALEHQPASGVCGRCRLSPPPFDRCVGIFRYESPFSDLIAEFKFHGNLASGRVLSWLLGQAFQSHYGTGGSAREYGCPDLLVPVPLHRSRLRKRGFNQALVLAREASQHSGVRLASRLLERTRDTVPQSQLTGSRRPRNLRGAFRLRGSVPTSGLGHVAVIDDVITTTATAAAVSRALRQAGARRIDIWAVARA